MKFRTVALALALTFGVGAVAEAKKAPVHKVKLKKGKRPKSRKTPKRPSPKHVKHT